MANKVKKTVGYYRVKKSTKAFFAKEAKKAGFKVVGKYMDYLATVVKKAKRSKKALSFTT